MTDTEEGLVLAQSGENYSLAVDSELDWTTAVIDLAGFVASNNAVFQNATAIRLTIGIPDTNIAGDSSGKIVINEINFEGVPFDNLSPALAKIQFIVPSVLGVPSLSGSFPDMTEDDKAMLWELSNDIAAGNTASVRYSPVINQELKYYKNIVFYVYTPSSSNFPDDTGLEIRFELQNGGIVKYALPLESFQNGWNEITIPVHSGNSLLINGQQENGIISETISSPVSSYMFSLKSDSSDIPADNYLLLDELVTDGYSGRFSSIGSAGITFSLAEGLIPVQGGKVISKLSGALQGEVDAAITDEMQIKNYSTAGNIDGSIIDCFPFKFNGYYSAGSPDFEADQNIVSDISAMLGFSHENLDWLPELAVSYHAGNSYAAAAGNQDFSASLEEIIHDELESVSYSYSFAQRSEKTENPSGAVPYLEHEGSAELYFPYVVFEGNVKVTQQFDDVDIFSIVPLSYLGSFINGKFINYQNNQTVNNQVDEYISISLTPEFLINFNASQSLKWSSLLYPVGNANSSMDHSIELKMPFTFGNIVITPGISRVDTKKAGIAVDFNTSLSSQFSNLFSMLGGEDISSWLRAPLEQLKIDPLYSDLTNAVLSETLSLDFSQQYPPAYLPDSIETYFHREASITSSIESIEMNIGGKIKKRVFKELENNSTLNTNGSLFLDVTDNWLYQERDWKVGFAWFLLYLRPESQWTADMSIQYRRNNLNTELPDLNTMYVIDDSTSMLGSASISLFRPVEYRDNKLFDTFTNARHTESLKLELGFFPQELIPVHGTSRILFQTGFTHTSEFFIYENFSLEASLFLQGGREEFWVSGEPEYRDSAGVELRLAGHQYF
ncbi:MAG TPA: hypothetical protein DCO79_09520 [Spirochaeta sp.]|nr:hypothetical protein [Spirochaeta sp.]